MQKIVINASYGGFEISELASTRYRELAGVEVSEYRWELKRDDPHLVQVVEELGEAANTRYSTLKIVEIPAGVEWSVHKYDGMEWVAENHRTWS